MTTRFASVDQNQTYRCGFEPHSEGHFLVGNKKYRPFWPYGTPKNRDDQVIEELVNQTAQACNRFYGQTERYPTDVRAARFPNGSIRIFIKLPEE
ncbi:MAG: hypothetical protein ABIH92_01190 [Nanoarchaeota archaeon]